MEEKDMSFSSPNAIIIASLSGSGATFMLGMAMTGLNLNSGFWGTRLSEVFGMRLRFSVALIFLLAIVKAWAGPGESRDNRCFEHKEVARYDVKGQYYPVKHWVQSSARVLSDGHVVVGTAEGKLYVFKPDGERRVVHTLSEREIASSPAVMPDGRIVVGSNDKNLYFVDPYNPEKKTAFKTGGTVSSSPVVMADGSVVVGSGDGKLYFLYPDGTLKASFRTGGSVKAVPTIKDDGTVVIGSYDKKIYFLKLSENPTQIFKQSMEVPCTGENGSASGHNGPGSGIKESARDG